MTNSMGKARDLEIRFLNDLKHMGAQMLRDIALGQARVDRELRKAAVFSALATGGLGHAYPRMIDDARAIELIMLDIQRRTGWSQDETRERCQKYMRESPMPNRQAIRDYNWQILNAIAHGKDPRDVYP